MASDKMTIPMAIEISMQTISNLLCNAFEGGVGYWCQIVEYVPSALPLPTLQGNEKFEYLVLPLTQDGAVILRDIEAHPELDGSSAKRYTMRLDRQAIRDGLIIMAQDYPEHFRDIFTTRADATTGDVFLQCCLFGESIYG